MVEWSLMKKVLFVCTKNKIRSQMAEAIFNHLAKNAVAESAGTDPADEVDPRVSKALKEARIIFPEDARPKDVTNEMMDNADLVVSFGCLVPSLFSEDKFEEWDIFVSKIDKEFHSLRDQLITKIEQLIRERRF